MQTQHLLSKCNDLIAFERYKTWQISADCHQFQRENRNHQNDLWKSSCGCCFLCLGICKYTTLFLKNLFQFWPYKELGEHPCINLLQWWSWQHDDFSSVTHISILFLYADIVNMLMILCQVWCEYQCLGVLYISKYVGAFDKDMLFRLPLWHLLLLLVTEWTVSIMCWRLNITEIETLDFHWEKDGMVLKDFCSVVWQSLVLPIIR